MRTSAHSLLELGTLNALEPPDACAAAGPSLDSSVDVRTTLEQDDVFRFPLPEAPLPSAQVVRTIAGMFDHAGKLPLIAPVVGHMSQPQPLAGLVCKLNRPNDGFAHLPFVLVPSGFITCAYYIWPQCMGGLVNKFGGLGTSSHHPNFRWLHR